MKFSTVAPLFLAATSAYATSLTSGYDLLRSRQHKVHRDLLDVCVGLDVDLTLADILRNGELLSRIPHNTVCLCSSGLPLVAGHIDVCLCVSLIPDFIQANAVAQAAVNLVGVAKVTALLEGLVSYLLSVCRV